MLHLFLGVSSCMLVYECRYFHLGLAFSLCNMMDEAIEVHMLCSCFLAFFVLAILSLSLSVSLLFHVRYCRHVLSLRFLKLCLCCCFFLFVVFVGNGEDGIGQEEWTRDEILRWSTDKPRATWHPNTELVVVFWVLLYTGQLIHLW